MFRILHEYDWTLKRQLVAKVTASRIFIQQFDITWQIDWIISLGQPSAYLTSIHSWIEAMLKIHSVTLQSLYKLLHHLRSTNNFKNTLKRYFIRVFVSALIDWMN
jgi:hypothetical protein